MVNHKPSLEASLVAHGFQKTQEYQKDSPTCSRESIRLVLALIASKSWMLQPLDIKTAFLQGESIDRTIFIYTPPKVGTDKLWHLCRCICGLADVPCCFYLCLRDVLSSLGVQPSPILDEGLFFAHCPETKMITDVIACHIDDLLYGGTEHFH